MQHAYHAWCYMLHSCFQPKGLNGAYVQVGLKSVKSDLTERQHHWKNCFWGCSNSPMMGTFANLETNELKHKNELVQVSWDVDDLLFGSQRSSSGFDTIPETITNRGEGKDNMDVLLHLHRCKACAITIKTPRSASLIHLSRQQFDSK